MKKLFMILFSSVLMFACSNDSEETVPTTEISVGTESIAFLSSGDIATGENALTVTSSDKWRLAGKKTWCRPSVTEGKTGDKVEFIVDENPTGDSRSITYSFMCGNKTTKLVVTQYGVNVITPEDTYTMGATSELLKIKLQSNIAITPEVSAGAKSWISPYTNSARSMTTSYLYYTIGANDTHLPRKGAITLKGEGIEPRVITVNQKQNDEIKADKALYKNSQLTATTFNVTVWSNVPFSVVIPENAKSWLTLTSSQPTTPTEWSSQVLTFSLTEASETRTSEVTLDGGSTALMPKITFQQGEMPIFDVPDVTFREYLLTNKFITPAEDNKYMTTAAGSALTMLDVYLLYDKNNGGCRSMAGIEYFKNVTIFNCSFNSVSSLDLSKNPKITDVSKCVSNALTYIKVGSGVTTIPFGAKNAWSDGPLKDFTTKAFSKTITIIGESITNINTKNNKLETLDVSGCPKLTILTCTQETPLTTIFMSESQRGQVTITQDPSTQIVYR